MARIPFGFACFSLSLLLSLEQGSCLEAGAGKVSDASLPMAVVLEITSELEEGGAREAECHSPHLFSPKSQD